MTQTKPLRISVSSQSAKAIKRLREEKGWSQSELAKKAGVPRARIKRLECMELKTILSSEFGAICRKLDMLFEKTPKKTSKKKTTTRTKRPSTSKGLPLRTPTGKLSRKDLMKKLENLGILDLTLREFLGG